MGPLTAPAAWLVALSLTATAAAAPNAESALRFTVLLDGEPIGQHHFRLRNDGDLLEVISEADFRVKFMFLEVYRYRHRATERWRGDCLVSMSARTDSNGEIETVEAARNGQDMLVKSNHHEEVLEGCVRSFAYWNPSILGDGRLLNAQTGKYQAVSLQPLNEESIQIRGRKEVARRYRLTGKQVDIDLWYAGDQQWLALESSLKGGRRLRYERN